LKVHKVNDMRRIALYILLIILPLGLAAQHQNHYGSESGSYKESPDAEDSTTKYNLPVNECSAYFYGGTDSTNTKFKTVTITTYRCDSNMNTGPLMSVDVINYNEKGQTVLDITKTHKGKTAEKIVSKYDKNFRVMQTLKYDTNSHGRLYLSDIEKAWYTPKGLTEKSYSRDRNDLEDLEVDVEKETWKYDSKDRVVYNCDKSNEISGFIFGNRDVSREYTKFDSAGNVLEDITYERPGWFDRLDGETADTTINHTIYNKNNMPVYSEYKPNYGSLSRTWYKYNEKGQEIFNASSSNYGDSVSNVSEYDKDGKLATRNKYRNGKLEDAYSVRFDKDKNMIENEEEISTATETSCANNVVTTTVTDSNGNELSKVETKIENAKPFTTTTTHKYTFHKNYILTDTCTMVEEGHFYAMTSQQNTKNTFDSHYNQTEFFQESGGNYKSSAKWKRQYDEYDNIIYDANYNACDDYKPENETITKYYPGGKVVEQETTDNGYKRVTTYYDQKGVMVKKLSGPSSCGTEGYYRGRYADYFEQTEGDMQFVLTVYTYQQ